LHLQNGYPVSFDLPAIERRTQAWWPETSRLAQDPPRDQRKTPEIRAIEVTSSIGDAPMLPDLSGQAPTNQELDFTVDAPDRIMNIAGRQTE